MCRVTFFLFSFFLFGCSRPSVEGLWLVEQVSVGNEIMTPQARWVKFEANGLQQSGNGWLQHSTGNWEYNPQTQLLNIHNENGLLDPFGPFQVLFEREHMIWKREEDGQPVYIQLAQIPQIPTSKRDQLIGVWELKSVVSNEVTQPVSDEASGQIKLFLRWDNAFVLTDSEKGRFSGIYQTHGHRPQLRLYFNESCQKEDWEFELKEEVLTLSQEESNEKIIKQYRRSNEFW